MPELRELLSVDFWREHILGLAYAGTGVVFFVIFVIAGFPYDRALTGTLAPMGLELSYSDQRPRFPIGSVLENVSLIDLRQPGGRPIFQSDRMGLAPGLGTLIGRPAIHINADAYDGIAEVALRQSGDDSTVKFDLKGIDLARYPIPAKYGVSVRGVIDADGNLQVDNLTKISRAGAASVAIRGLALGMGRALPHVSFSRISANITIRNGVVTINRLEGTGPDAALSINGTIRLAPTPQQMTIDLTMRLTPTALGRAHLGFLLTFLPHPPNARPYLIRGPLMAPALS